MSPDTARVPRIVVVGAGVAGLATAFLLREIGKESDRQAEITVLEAKDQPGGSTRTDHIDGYTCEWGPNGFLDNEPATLELVERLGLTSRLLRAGENSSHRFIYHGGKMREVPTKPPAFLVSDIVPVSAKLRMAMELIVPAKRNGHEETVYSFGERRLGRFFADFLLDPMVSGIFAGNAKELSLPAVFPKMVEMEREYGGLFKAMIAKQKEAKRTGKVSGGPAGASATLHTFQNGMGELTSTLASLLKSDLRISSTVRALQPSGQHFVIRSDDAEIIADSVVLACPSYAAADIIQGIALQAARSIREIPYAPVDVVCHGHKKSDFNRELNGFGVLVPRSEGIRSLGCLWCDSIFAGQAPTDHHLLRTMIGGAHDPSVVNLSGEELEGVARKDHERLFGLQGEPEFRRVFRHQKGIAQYTLGHLDRVAATEKLEDDMPGLYFTGASYRGVSVNGCAKDAFRVARRFWQQWEERR
jgi:protoporphyrinogen/coproporphyrinogen III oxidase